MMALRPVPGSGVAERGTANLGKAPHCHPNPVCLQVRLTFGYCHLLFLLTWRKLFFPFKLNRN